SIEILVGLDVAVRIGAPSRFTIILFRKEARGPEDDAWEAVITMEELAKIFRGFLRHAVDVARDRRELLRHPDGGRTVRRRERTAEHARRAGEHESAHAIRNGALQE